MKKTITLIFLSFFLCGIFTSLYSQKTKVSKELNSKSTTSYSLKSQTIKEITDSRDDPVNSFDSPSTSSTGIDYDPVRGGFWIASQEDGGHTYLIDPDDGTVMEDIDLVGIAIALDGKQTGVDVLPSGNLLYADYRGDLSVIDDYLFEIDPDAETLVNYWPTSGTYNTSTDGTSIENVIDVAMCSDGYAYVTDAFDNKIYKIELNPGTPGTWSTEELITAPAVDNVVGIDMLCEAWIISDYASTKVAFLNYDFSLMSTIMADHDGNSVNSGACFVDATYPNKVAVTDMNTDKVAIYLSGIKPDQTPPEITCPGPQERNSDDTHTYTVVGDEFDPVSVSDNCGLKSIINDYNDASTLAGAIFPEGTEVVKWVATDTYGNTANCMFSVTVIDDSGIDDLTAAGFKIYPNPSKGIFQIEQGNNELVSYKITDITGKTIKKFTKEQKQFTIDLSDQPEGIYLINIKTDKGNYTARLMVE